MATMRPEQKPLELILARNLLSSMTAPAFLVDRPGNLIYYNDAAGEMLGRRFEETGSLAPEEWVGTFGPFDEKGDPMPIDELSLTKALRGDRPAHDTFHIRSIQGEDTHIEATGFPILGSNGFFGAVILFWPSEEDGE